MKPFWARPVEEVLAELGSRAAGLSATEASERLAGLPRERRAGRSAWAALAGQFLNPLVLMLVVASGLSAITGDVTDALIILAIVAMSGGVGFFQERSADRAVAALLQLVHARASVRRDGAVSQVSADEVVPGDVVSLSVGATVPGDARVIASEGLQVDEAALTGESFPVAKRVEPVADDVAPGGRASAVFLGTHVVSGTAEAVIVAVGASSELGKIGQHLERQRPPTDFDVGLRHFGNMLATVSILIVLVIFAVNVALARPVLDSFLFAVALAVGLVPELLPAIVTVNLTRGAKRMADSEVIVKRLSSIEDFGAVDVLCSDKTGTITEGHVALHGAIGLDGEPSSRALELAWLNATFESGYANPMDEALRRAFDGDVHAWRRIGEVAYDFVRKRLSVAVEGERGRLLVTKGQVGAVIEACATAETRDGRVPIDDVQTAVGQLHERLATQGMRTLALAVRDLQPGDAVSRDLEREMTLVGLLAFADPVKGDAGAVVAELEELGVSLKVVTGDDRRVATHVWTSLRGAPPTLLTGAQIRAASTHALERLATDVDVFAEVDPTEKERVVQALRRSGRVVAYLGDGINDAPALRTADVGISVDSAADVAREAADLVLRRRDLSVVAAGIREGRRTMVNTIKYVHYTTSANFGNMVSMAAASLFLPFLPLLPTQILLNNFLSALPALTIASDRVDAGEVVTPRRWRNSEIRPFMIVFGSISSAFDILMFVVLLKSTAATATLFRSGWFVGSLLTEVLVLLVLRTRLSFLASRPSTALLATSLLMAVVSVLVPYVPVIGPAFAFEPLPAGVLAAIVAISLAYVAATEGAKRVFFRRSTRGAAGSTSAGRRAAGPSG